ncbi:nucleic-acid-binding protein from transposon x-element, partial [Lasius niger]
MFNKKISTPPSDPLESNPFAKNARILRSPLLKSNQQQHQLEGALSQSESFLPQANIKVANEAAILEKLNQFEKLCETLQKEVNDLKVENQRLKDSLLLSEKSNDVSMKGTEIVNEFHTDEEELALETDWILKKNRKKNAKKRKAESSPEMDNTVITSKPSKSGKETVKVIKTKDKEIAKIIKPPPVILSNITDFNKVQDVMSSQKIKYEIKLLNNKQLSIKVNSADDYRLLTKLINEAKFEWHSYENKATRPCKVIARGLHPNCNVERIQHDLNEQGFNILSVVNIIKKKKENDKVVIDQLPIYMLNFDHSEDIDKIFSITHILNTKVKIEALKKQGEFVPQCKRCQRFEHTQAFCNREPRCVKCAGSHLTTECKLDRKAPPKCSNCHEAQLPRMCSGNRAKK